MYKKKKNQLKCKRHLFGFIDLYITTIKIVRIFSQSCYSIITVFLDEKQRTIVLRKRSIII